MTSVVETIRAGIETRVAATLTGWSRLIHAHDVKKNAQAKATNRYAVLVAGSIQAPSPVCAVHMGQEYEILLTSSWVSVSDGDFAVTQATSALQGYALSVYQNLAATKCGVPANCILVRDLILSEPELLEEQKVILQRARFTVLYRVSV